MRLNGIAGRFARGRSWGYRGLQRPLTTLPALKVELVKPIPIKKKPSVNMGIVFTGMSVFVAFAAIYLKQHSELKQMETKFKQLDEDTKCSFIKFRGHYSCSPVSRLEREENERLDHRILSYQQDLKIFKDALETFCKLYRPWLTTEVIKANEQKTLAELKKSCGNSDTMKLFYEFKYRKSLIELLELLNKGDKALKKQQYHLVLKCIHEAYTHPDWCYLRRAGLPLVSDFYDLNSRLVRIFSLRVNYLFMQDGSKIREKVQVEEPNLHVLRLRGGLVPVWKQLMAGSEQLDKIQSDLLVRDYDTIKKLLDHAVVEKVGADEERECMTALSRSRHHRDSSKVQYRVGAHCMNYLKKRYSDEYYRRKPDSDKTLWLAHEIENAFRASAKAARSELECGPESSRLMTTALRQAAYYLDRHEYKKAIASIDEVTPETYPFYPTLFVIRAIAYSRLVQPLHASWLQRCSLWLFSPMQSRDFWHKAKLDLLTARGQFDTIMTAWERTQTSAEAKAVFDMLETSPVTQMVRKYERVLAAIDKVKISDVSSDKAVHQLFEEFKQELVLLNDNKNFQEWKRQTDEIELDETSSGEKLKALYSSIAAVADQETGLIHLERAHLDEGFLELVSKNYSTLPCYHHRAINLMLKQLEAGEAIDVRWGE